ncbi:phage tail protein, partial [Pseudomonas aeruginosa]
ATSGSNPTTLGGYGITDALAKSDAVDAPAPNKLLRLNAASQLPASITGNAATATKLAVPRMLSFTGDATGSASFDGSANAAVALTLANSGVTAGTYAKVTVNGKGLVTGGAQLTAADIPALDAGKVVSGVLPIARGGTGNAIGQAATAVKLASPRTLAIAGDATGSAAFDGSANASISVTLANTGVAVGTYTKVRVNAKGLVTSAASLTADDVPWLDASKVTSGMFADARLPWYAQGLCTSAPNTTDPNTTNIPLILTNHENGPIPGTFFYIQTMMYNQRNGNAAQIAVRYAANAEMYVRYMYDVGNKRGVWSAWKRCDVGGSFAKEADGELGGGVNLDTMIASGWWHQPFSANAKNGTNYPVGEAGLLTVHAPTSTMIYQTYRGYAAGGLYWRCRYNGTWSAWYRAWDSGNFNPANYVAKSEYSWASLPGKPATFPPSGHNHDATQITSGILPLARGGLGANNAVTARSNIGAGTIATASLGSSGWWRDNDTGYIRQWGRVTVPGDGSAAITFPIAFPSVCLGGFAGQTANFHPGTDASTSFYNQSTTGATLENGYQFQAVLLWEAFGR